MNLQVTGTLAGIEARNAGWFAVHIQEQGQQYPKKLSTKKPDLLQLAQQLIGQQVTALYNESESTNTNPNTGQPYTNRYLEALGLAGTMPPPQAPYQPSHAPQQPAYTPPPQQPVMQQAPQQPQYTPPPANTGDALREQKIHRQSAAKVAVALLPLLTPEDQNLASLVRISEQLVQYFDQGVAWAVPPVQPNPHPHNPSNPGYPPTQEQQQDPGPDPSYQPPADDDIPF